MDPDVKLAPIQAHTLLDTVRHIVAAFKHRGCDVGEKLSGPKWLSEFVPAPDQDDALRIKLLVPFLPQDPPWPMEPRC